MSCSCRKFARCLACIERAGRTKTPEEMLTLGQLEERIATCLDERRAIPRLLTAEMRRRGLLWDRARRRLIHRSQVAA